MMRYQQPIQPDPKRAGRLVTVLPALYLLFFLSAGYCTAGDRDLGAEGIAEIQASMGFFDRNIDALQLLQSLNQSKATEPLLRVQEIIEANGLHSTVVRTMSIGQLASLQTPALLMVKPYPDAPDYSRLVLYRGMREHQALVYSSPNPEKLLPLYVLASRWNGVALIVSRDSIHLPRAGGWSGWLPVLSFIALLAVFARVVRPGGQKRLFIARHSFWQGSAIFGIAALAGALQHVVRADGFLTYPRSTWPADFAPSSASIQFVSPDDPAVSPIPIISLSEAKEHLAQGHLFIDARAFNFYTRGHIRGAMNVPDSSGPQRHLAMAGIPKDADLIVYCSDKKCPRARTLAAGLREDGYTRLLVFDGGWEEWTNQSSR